MILKKLMLLNFRNYEKLYLEFNPKINLIVGKNAQGKTNIVESIYMMCIGKSFRTKKDREIIKFDEDNLYLEGHYQNNYREGSIEIAINKDKKGIKLNKVSINKIYELLGNLNVVIFSPEDLMLIKDGPKQRRNFIDKEISQIMPLYYNLLVNYNKVLHQRNKLLKLKNIDESLLDVYDESLSTYASEIMIIRNNFINKLNFICNNTHKKLTNNKENLKIIYKPQIAIDKNDSKETLKNKILKKLKSSKEHDLILKSTKYGIHKDDIEIFINDFDVKKYGSQGQQRMVSISMKLSELTLIKNETGEYPILILDDVFSELDETRQKLLINNLDEIQIFVTTAEKSHIEIFKKHDVTIFGIENGQVVKIENGGNLDE